MMAENSASQGRYGLGSTHACASTGFGDRSGWWRRQAADAVDDGSSEAGSPVWWHIPLDRLRLVEFGKRGDATDRRLDAVQVAFAGQAHLLELAHVDHARELRHSGASAAAPRAAVVPGQR